MSGKLQDYQVLNVLCGGAFYKVRHKVTRDVFAWKAYDCTAYSDDQIQSIAADARAINKERGAAAALLRLYDTVLHAPSRTLYFVLELGAWRSVAELRAACARSRRRAAEPFVWHLLLQLARVCRALARVPLAALRPRLAPAGVLVDARGAVRAHCFEPPAPAPAPALRQLGSVLQALCFAADNPTYYSDDLLHIIGLLTDDENENLCADVILYHPTVLTNIETYSAPKCFSEILVSVDQSHVTSVNKCDSEKAVDLCATVQPAPRASKTRDSPIYCNITPKRQSNKEVLQLNSTRDSISPTIAALALELPGFVPRSRKAIGGALEPYTPARQVSEKTFSQQWMSRLIALRQREQSLNQRERVLIAKEILNSPATKIVPLADTQDDVIAVCSESVTNGITLPPEISREDRGAWVSRRHQRTGSVRLKSRRKTFSYDDLDSSLSADNGDGSMIITATKITSDNMPRNLFPEPARKVHFTPANPFVESDDSVTLTFYELENVDKEGYQVPRQDEKLLKDITKFKYLDLEKMTSEKRAAMPWSHSSPSKQAKISQNIFSDITNTKGNLRKTPSKTSITSKGSSFSRFSIASGRSEWSMDSSSKVSDGSISERTRSSIRQTLAQTPVAPDARKKGRKSLLPFKTPFKFMSSTKI